MPTDDPVGCLAEIATLAMRRMNSGSEIAPDEAFTLGAITGIAMRVPAVSELVKMLEQESDDAG